jgi:uncharacterized membrane protein YeaQ/YmgE (transglycosylase-associated protein family)
MTLVTWLLAGGLVGWAACAYMGTPTWPAFIFNASIAVVGAAVGSWALGPMFDLSPGFSLFNLIVGAACGAVTLTVVHFARRRITA